MSNETPDQQRSRILSASPETSPFQYDSAVALGYEPEQWNGMWKLPAGHPINWITKRTAIVREVVYKPGTHNARIIMGRVLTRFRLRRHTGARL